jgi:hypothetical protein
MNVEQKAEQKARVAAWKYLTSILEGEKPDVTRLEVAQSIIQDTGVAPDRNETKKDADKDGNIYL